MSSPAPIAFPQVFQSPAAADATARARAHGEAVGYAEGARRAADELARDRADLEATTSALRARLTDDAARSVQLLDRAAADLAARVAPTVTGIEESLLDAALQMAEAIIGVELSDDTRAAHAAMRRALAAAQPAVPARMLVNPDDAPLVRDLIPAGVTLVEDARVARGDATADLAPGLIDASIASALQRARAALHGETR